MLNSNDGGEYLQIIKNFLLETHQRLSEQIQCPEIERDLLTTIDQASVKIKTTKEHLRIMEKQLREAQNAKVLLQSAKSQHSQLEKRLTNKADEVSILRQTIKTLYSDNERIAMEKEDMSKQLVQCKDHCVGLKKKVKRLEDQMGAHKQELRKLTNVAEERLGEYAKEDQGKSHKISKLGGEIERYKNQINKKDKNIQVLNKKIEDNKIVEVEYKNCIGIIEKLKYENNMMKVEMENIKEKEYREKTKAVEQNEQLLKQLSSLNDRTSKLSLMNKEQQIALQREVDKNKHYEEQILIRTDKLKQKSRQITTYAEQVNKLLKRVEQLSISSQRILDQNQMLSEKNKTLQEKIQQMNALQKYVSKIKNDLSNKKSAQLHKLFQMLGKLQQ